MLVVLCAGGSECRLDISINLNAPFSDSQRVQLDGAVRVWAKHFVHVSDTLAVNVTTVWPRALLSALPL